MDGHCNVCGSSDLLRMKQVGVINYQKLDCCKSWPEVMFDYLICKSCGAVKVDLETIRIVTEMDTWTGMKLEGEK